MVQCRLRTEDGEEVLGLDELEERLRAGTVPVTAWVAIDGLTQGFVRIRDAPLARQWDPVKRARFRAAFALDRVPLLVLLVAAACVVVWVALRESVDGPLALADLVRWGARARTAVLVDGEAWRMWTAALLHRDQWHLGFNVAVFVAVGGALESIYSRAGLLAVLAWGGACSALLSLWVGPQVTVGLSGVVFASLGAAISFGVRFRDVLRSPYQEWFGVVASAYALFALWTGAREPDVDHAGHLGGLLGGLMVGAVLPPRRWDAGPARWRVELGALAGAGALTLLMVVGVWWGASTSRPATPFRVPNAGVTLHIPFGFRAVRDAFGLGAFDNGLDAQISAACARMEAAWPAWEGRGQPAVEIGRELARLAVGRKVLDFTPGATRWTTVGGETPATTWPAQELALTYRVDDEPVVARVLAWERGLGRCALVLSTGPGVRPVRHGELDRVRTSVRFHDTDALEAARRRTERDETDANAWLDLGLAALHQGDGGPARSALLRAARLADEERFLEARAHYALAQVGLMQLDARLALPHAERARDLVPEDVDAAVALYGALRLSGQKDAPVTRTLVQALKQVRPGVVRP